MGTATAVEEKRLGGVRISTRLLLAVLVPVLLGGLGYLIWWSLQPPGLRSVRLRDGTRVALASVTYGTMHRFDPAPPLFRLARGLRLPKKIPDVATVTTAKSEMRLWFYIRPSPSPASWDGYVVFEDAHGCPFDEGKNDSVAWGDEKDMWYSLRPTIPLENGQAFDYCAFDRKLNQEVARFHVAPITYPVSGSVHQVLKLRPLPQTVVSGDLRATLVSIKSIPTPAQPHYRAGLRAVNSRGAVMSPMSLSVEDRFGRRMESLDSTERQELPGEGFPFLGLCRREPAWKLTAVMAADPVADDHPDTVWDFPSVRWDGKHAEKRSGPHSLVVCQGNFIPLGSNKGKERCLKELLVRSPSRDGPGRIAVTHINGQKTQDVVSSFPSGFPASARPILMTELPQKGEWCRLDVPLLDSDQTISVRLAEYRGRKVEFIVQPPAPR